MRIGLSLVVVLVAVLTQAAHAESEPPDRRTEERIAHLLKAAEDFEAAGLRDKAEEIRQRVLQEQMSLQQDLLKQKLAELEKLQAEVDRLRNLTGQPLQVMVHVRILEAPRNVLGELGLDQSPEAADKAVVDVADLIQEDGSHSEKIEKLRRSQRLKVLADPSLVGTVGRPASLTSGGEFPVFLRNPGAKDSVEWRKYGTFLELVPANLGKGRFLLDLSTEFTTRDFANAVVVQGNAIPGLNTRKTKSQVELQAGQTIVLGGMISARGENGKTAEIATVILVRCELLDATPVKVPPVPADE